MSYTSVTLCTMSEHEGDGEIDLEEHRRHLHYVSRVKEATVCFVPNRQFVIYLTKCKLIEVKKFNLFS